MPSIVDRVQLLLGRKTVDPVCGMVIAKAKAAETSEHDGNTYYFCSAGCKQSFEANPGQYR